MIRQVQVVNKKQIIYIILAILISFTVFLTGYTTDSSPVELYRVYLEGETIGYITSEVELNEYIDKKEAELKAKYKVDKIYAPKNLKIIKEIAYNKSISSVQKIYSLIKQKAPFTINGYTVTIKGVEEIQEGKKYTSDNVIVNVLDKEIFTEALKTTMNVFVSESDYQDYINKTQAKINNTGKIIENVYIQNEMTIKQNKLSVNDKIFLDSEELSKFLLFGTLDAQKTYKVKEGDTIEDVSYNNKLSVEEFLIINDDFNSSDNLLYPGEIVKLGVVKPTFKLIEEDHVVELETEKYKTEIVYDNSLLVGVERVKQKGKNGTNKVTKKIKKANGEIVSAVVVSSEVMTPAKNKIIVRGKGTISTGSLGSWAWPTKTPYVITSNYGWRWGKFHDGLDISGTGHGSPIYAANDGVVVEAAYTSFNGNYIIINHNNGYYTNYGHMSKLLVKKGDIVSIGQQIGKMGSTGFSTGTHLHFGVWKGYPYVGGTSINPISVCR